MESVKKPSYSIDFPEVVHSLSFANFEWGSHLLAVGGQGIITIGTCKFEGEGGSGDGLVYKQLLKFNYESRMTGISWSPESSLLITPAVVKFAVSSADGKLRLFTSDLAGQDREKVLHGHSDSVNDVAFDADAGDKLASVSDDGTCRLWRGDGEDLTAIPLGAPGMSVAWHQEEPSKIMIGLKTGIVLVFSVHSNLPIMSLDCGNAVLLSADWSPLHSVSVVAATTTQCFVFDTSLSSRPLSQVHDVNECHREARWCCSNDKLLATTGRPGQPVKVYHLTHGQVVVSGAVEISNGLSWHHHLPILAVGGDRKVHFWNVDIA